jgi:hypothetical protein
MMTRHTVILVPVAAAAAALAGCSNVVATTEVRPDGSFTRTTAYTAYSAGASLPKTAPGLGDTFVLPAGKPWKVSKTVAGDEVRCVATWSGPAGSQVNRDVSVRGMGDPAVLVSNGMQVARVGDNTYTYTERLKWLGPRPSELLKTDPALLKALKSALPASPTADREAAEMSRRITVSVWRMMFGPGDTVLGQFLTQPYAAERTLRRRLGNDVLAQVNTVYTERLSESQRVAVARRIVNAVSSLTRAKTQTKSGSRGTGGLDRFTSFPSLTFVLRCPGRVVSTNGQEDDLAGEIYWTLYPEAAAVEDVVLKATWQVP